MHDDAMALDGNAIAGLLRDLFERELTEAPRSCASCGERHPIGAHRVYRGAGLVLRCPTCDDIAMLVVTLPDRTIVQLTGSWTLSLTRP
ncbi:MAG: hypothetical protein QOI43_566 [Gaiellales bacterium]|nr:hypothetical protein [Gaiellales bacterium]